MLYVYFKNLYLQADGQKLSVWWIVPRQITHVVFLTLASMKTCLSVGREGEKKSTGKKSLTIASKLLQEFIHCEMS